MACKQGIRRGAVDRHGRSIEKQELRTEKANLQVIEDRLASLQRKAEQLCDLQVDDHLENCPFASARNSKERAELVIDLYDGIDGLEESVGHNVDPMVLLIQLSGIRSRLPFAALAQEVEEAAQLRVRLGAHGVVLALEHR